MGKERGGVVQKWRFQVNFHLVGAERAFLYYFQPLKTKNIRQPATSRWRRPNSFLHIRKHQHHTILRADCHIYIYIHSMAMPEAQWKGGYS